MGKERIGGDSSNQGQDLAASWERLAAVSNNYGEQQPSGAEVNGDMQGGDETQGEQGVATPMTFDDLRQIVTEIDNVYWEYNNKIHNTKSAAQREREEILADQAEQIKQAWRELDRRYDEIIEATSARLQQIEEPTEAARAMDLVRKESLKRMDEAIAPLVAVHRASNDTLRQFIHDFNEQRKRGELTLDDVELSYFVMDIAESNFQQRRDVLLTIIDLEREEAAPWEAKVSESSPRACLVCSRESLPEKHQHPALKVPVEVWRGGEHAIGEYIRGILKPYVRGGIISPRYSVHVDEESYYDGVHIREIRIESDCGGFTFPENTTDRLDS